MATEAARRSPRIALIGLRGAGKTTLGQMLADELGFAFVELSREIEKVRRLRHFRDPGAVRHERLPSPRAARPGGGDPRPIREAVIATPGGIVSDPAAFNLLLGRCTTVWLQARPEDHMRRVAAQGDLRPMAASDEAMEDLKGILAGRAAFYSKAELQLDTSAQPLEETFSRLRDLVHAALARRP